MSQIPRMAQAVSDVASWLQPQYAEEGIPADVLGREAERLGGYGRDSVVPADYCYNVINRASYSLRHPVLLRVGRGRYKHVGSGYAYTGPVLWKPVQEGEQQVGSWTDGILHLEYDPRR